MDPGHGLELDNNARAVQSGGTHGEQRESSQKRRKKQGPGTSPGGKSVGRSSSQATGSSAGKRKSKGKAKLPDGRFRVDTFGNEICWNWNKDSGLRGHLRRRPSARVRVVSQP